MTKITHKLHNQLLRKKRIRATISGTAERPRLSVFISNMHVTAQIVNDEKHNTLIYVSSVGMKEVPKTLTDKAGWVGTEIAKKAKAAKIKHVVFDRGSRIYHGRVKVLAEAARNGGLEF